MDSQPGGGLVSHVLYAAYPRPSPPRTARRAPQTGATTRAGATAGQSPATGRHKARPEPAV